MARVNSFSCIKQAGLYNFGEPALKENLKLREGNRISYLASSTLQSVQTIADLVRLCPVPSLPEVSTLARDLFLQARARPACRE